MPGGYFQNQREMRGKTPKLASKQASDTSENLK